MPPVWQGAVLLRWATRCAHAGRAWSLRAWAADAEDHFNEGNGCYFEIRSFDSASGSAVEVSITAEGYDIEEIAE